MEKNPTVKQETWVQSLGWEDLLEKGVATHSSILPGESLSMDRGDWREQSMQVAESYETLDQVKPEVNDASGIFHQ